MKKKINEGLTTFAIVCFIFGLLVTMFNLAVFNERFFETQYKALNTAESMNMSDEDLMLATHTLLDYLQNKRDDINVEVVVEGKNVPMFNQKEIDHMVDVKDLFTGLNSLQMAAYVIFIILIVALTITNRMSSLTNSIYRALGVYLFVIGGIALYAFIDFSGFWVIFHKVLFSNDLWLLNPNTDRMINMFPEVFFNRLVIRVMIHFVIVFVAMYIIAKIREKREI
ncbi:MAG: TIGR01906 family membrane protein [Erysipelothrix sp.]|nr:TIGR01906 family membrane protein [Erysipelothrix sp.]